MAEPVVLINAFEVPAASAEAFIAAWERTRDYLKTQPGYVDTTLHQALAPDAEFLFVNVARWRTAEDLLTATRGQGFREAAAGMQDARPHPALYRVVRN
jgi:heme oxygenase (mycobilin-producing)